MYTHVAIYVSITDDTQSIKKIITKSKLLKHLIAFLMIYTELFFLNVFYYK